MTPDDPYSLVLVDKWLFLTTKTKILETKNYYHRDLQVQYNIALYQNWYFKLFQTRAPDDRFDPIQNLVGRRLDVDIDVGDKQLYHVSNKIPSQQQDCQQQDCKQEDLQTSTIN